MKITIVGFNVDFPQASASSHHTGHNSIATCTACMARRGPANSPEQYSFQSNSADLCVARSAERNSAIRDYVYLDDSAETEEIRLRNELLKFMGLDHRFVFTARDVSDSIEKDDCVDGKYVRKKKPAYRALRLLGEMGTKSGSFCDSMCVIAAPDHLWYLGTGKDNLNVVFFLLGSPNARKELEDLLIATCKKAGLTTPAAILKKSGAGGWCLGLSVSEMAAVLLVTPACLSYMQKDRKIKPTMFEACTKLTNAWREMVNLIYYTPEPCTSSYDEALERYTNVRRLNDRYAEYLDMVTEMCRGGGKYEKRVAEAVIHFVQCPNLHRGQECVSLWLPGVGYNIRHLMEMVFEKVHQIVKQMAEGNEIFNNLGLFIHNRLGQKETLARVELGQSEDPNGPASDFAWNADTVASKIFQACTAMQYGQRQKRDRPENKFITIHDERNWGSPGSKEEVLEEVAEHLNKLLSLDLQLHERDYIAICARVGFGATAAAHNCLVRGDFVSGLVNKKAVVLSKTGGVKNSQKRVVNIFPPPLENNLKAPFPKQRVVMQVEHLYEINRAPLGEVYTESSVLVKGREFVLGDERFPGSAGIFNSTGSTVWMKLDSSCRRVLAVPWVGMGENESDSDSPGHDRGYCDVTMDAEDTHGVKQFVVYLRKNGYPSKAG